MRSFVAFRLSAQLCFCAAVLCVFSPFRAHWPAFALLPALALPAGFGAAGCARPSARLLWGLLPCLALILPASGWAVRAALALPALYAAGFLAAGRFVPDVRQYRVRVLLMLALTVLIALVSGSIDARNLPPLLLAPTGLVLGLLALRAMQLGTASSLRWQAANVGLFFLPVAAGALAGALLSLSKPILLLLTKLLSALFAALLSAWTGLWDSLMRRGGIDAHYLDESTEPLPTEALESGLWSPTEAFRESPRPPGLVLPWNAILILAAVAALALLLIWLLRRSAPIRKQPGSAAALRETPLAPGPRGQRSRRGRRADRNDRARVRAVYREYLRYLGSRGVLPARSATTAEISASAARVLPEPDETLRALYRKARYSPEPVTELDRREAEACLAQLTQRTPGEASS